MVASRRVLSWCSLLLVRLCRQCCLAASSVPAIVDTDIGTFMDDTFALSQTLLTPELDLQLVVTASDDTTARARVAARHLRLVGASHVPLAIGVPTKVGKGALYAWGADEDLSQYPGGVEKDGVEAMRRVIDNNKQAPWIALITIGPHTNVKSLVDRYPHVQTRLKIFVMGGSVVPGIPLPWGGEKTPVNTTNERFDPPAARTLLRGHWAEPTSFAGVASTINVVINGSYWQDVLKSTSSHAKVAMECYHAWWKESRRDKSVITHGEGWATDPAKASPVLFDTVAVHLAATSSKWLDVDLMRIDFGEYGDTIVLPQNSTKGGPARFALRWTGHGQADLQMFVQELTSRFTSAPTPTTESIIL